MSKATALYKRVQRTKEMRRARPSDLTPRRTIYIENETGELYEQTVREKEEFKYRGRMRGDWLKEYKDHLTYLVKEGKVYVY